MKTGRNERGREGGREGGGRCGGREEEEGGGRREGEGREGEEYANRRSNNFIWLKFYETK